MIGKYTDLMFKFLDKGYKDVFFNELSSEYNQLIIRHDVDFDCEFAYKMAKIEYILGVRSTYFFMLSNSIYNLFSEKNRRYVKNIKTLGHNISIHFDFEVGDLKKEIDIFESFFDTEVDIISIHRPDLELLNQIDVEHTYLPKYFEDIKYFADSRGEFRFGHPLKSKEFQEGKSIHLLIHPAWWMSDKKDTIDIIENIIDRNHEMNKKFFRENSIPYREHSND
jgi:hypothetical protein